MKRSTSNTARVYAYGCDAPRVGDGLEAINAEYALQRAMWDALVHADNRAERAKLDLAADDPCIGPLVAEIDRISHEIGEAAQARRAERQKARSKVDTPELDARIAELVDARKAARKALWPLLSDWRKTHKAELRAVDQQFHDEAKLIRQQSGLFWGNYNAVLDRFDVARKLARKKSGRPRFSDPTRRDGVLRIQVQRTKTGLGASMAEIMSGAVNALQITPAVAHDIEQRKRARVLLRFRVNAAGDMAELPVYIHRLPPAGWRIKTAELAWKPEGERLRWQLTMTAVGPAQTPKHSSPRACGIDVGWRLQPDGGLLVATVMGTENRKPQRLVLPARWMGAMDQMERLQQHVDDETLVLAQEWHNRVADLPDDLRLPLMRWRPKLGAGHVDCQALHDAVRARIDRVKGTDARADVPESIRHWYDRYRHLLVWRHNKRAKLMRERREHYRIWAKQVAQHYGLIGVEDVDLAAMALHKKRAPEDGDNPLHDAARAQRQRAAVHTLLLEIKHQANKAGAEIAEIPAKHTTMECHTCGEIVQKRDRAARIWQCSQGHQWDQDVNAAINIRDAAVGASGPVLSEAA